ncbi:hypothetical protein D3C73_765100 [compost metagenome]
MASDLTEADRNLLRKVLTSECDWLLDHYDVVGGLYTKDANNRPESNLWNGALLHRTASLYPDCSRAEQYREKGLTFLINSVSIPSDEWNEMVKDGKRVAERFVGANFFESMALNHHDYLNVGYMVICLSNMAMLHFAYKQRDEKAPEALYHHMRDLWEVVKLCTFDDGRLLRIGGDTRVRYTYCQDYVIPVWHMVKDLLDDPDCDHFEAGWLRQIRMEMERNGDDSFLSERCGALSRRSPLYYTRLESDRAAALSMGLAWRPLIGCPERSPQQSEARPQSEATVPRASAIISEKNGVSWQDEYHGAYLHRSDQRIASWVWEAAEKPQGLCLPGQGSDMAEWRENLSVSLKGLGRITDQRLERHDGQRFPGGFVTWGSMRIHTRGLLAEGQPDHDFARSQLVCAALPDNKHIIVLQYAAALEKRTYLHEVKGLHLLISNDVFNGNVRTYYDSNGKKSLQGARSGEEIVHTGSAWLNVDDQLGIIAAYGTDRLFINRPGYRQIGLKQELANAGTEGMHYADEICGPCEVRLQSIDAHQVIVDAGFVLQASERHQGTAAYAGSGELISSIHHEAAAVRGVQVRGADGDNYVLAANFGEIAEVVSLQTDGGCDVATGESLHEGESGCLKLTLQPGTALLVRLA